MTRDESRTLAITAGVLFVAGAARAGLEAVRPPLAVEADAVSAEALAEVSQEMVEERERRSAPLAADERLDPNTASEAELDRLPGVGPATAQAIVRSREEEGPFGGLESLSRVRGIGPATVEKLAPHVTLAPGSREPRARAAGLRAAANPIDLNRATAEELERVRGIGPALAARIIARRTEVGGFGRVDDLIEVRGIGPATLESLRGSFVVRR